MPLKENSRVVCAANYHRRSDTMFLGARHYDQHMVDHMALVQFEDPDIEQGFVDQHSTFLTRVEAWHVALANGQILRRVGGDATDGGTLYSENLY